MRPSQYNSIKATIKRKGGKVRPKEDSAPQGKRRAKKCKYCKGQFFPRFFNQKPCFEPQCILKHNRLIKEKEEEQRWKLKKQELKENTLTHKDYLKLLQTVFNTFIRLRDSAIGCVSCGTERCEEFHAGHYIATTYQALRFNEDNVWKQCSKCNTHLRGNSIPYRIELIKRIGLERVENLENQRHNTSKLSIPEIKELIVIYKAKIKKLKTPNR